jgi:hypothetical protein
VSEFDDVYTRLRAILEPYAARTGFLHEEKRGRYQLSSSTKKDRAGRPLFIACAEVKKTYVSFHLLPLYMNPALLALVPPALKKRMQGKACFNFTTVDPARLKELRDLTRQGIASFKNLQLPWEAASTKKKGGLPKQPAPSD